MVFISPSCTENCTIRVGPFATSHSIHAYGRARYFDPSTATFLTRDPIEPITEQPYQYAEDDPNQRATSVHIIVGGLLEPVIACHMRVAFAAHRCRG
jgi:hypothetical protein